LYALFLSFFTSDFLVFNREFVGISNYIEVLTDSAFWSSVGRTFSFSFFSVVGQLLIGFILALILNNKIKITNFLRTIIVIPWILSPVVVAVIFQILYIPNNTGLLNYILLSLGVLQEPVAWLGFEHAMTSVIIANIWLGMPFSMINILGGLQGIPEDLYEAARIDGASTWEQTKYITLPALKPTLITTLIWISSSTINQFDMIFALTGGGPSNRTSTLGVHMYNTAFVNGDFELGATVAIFIFIINICLTVFYRRLLRRRELY